jgi:hypothetical protein
MSKLQNLNKNKLRNKATDRCYARRSLSSNWTDINKPSWNALVPQVLPTCHTSPFNIPSTSTLAISTDILFTNFTIGSNQTFNQNRTNTAEQVLAQISNIKPVQPTIIDDKGIPSSTDLIYNPLQLVESSTTMSNC